MSAPDKIILQELVSRGDRYKYPVPRDVEYTRTDTIPNAEYVAGLEAAALKMDALLSDAFDVIDAPPPSYGPEPMDVRDFRHSAYCRMKSFFDAAISIRAALASRPASPDVRVVVKPLVWAKSHMSGWNDDYHTIQTGYTVRCADENGWKWQGHGAFGYCLSSTLAKAAAQTDHEARILSAIIAGQP